MQRIDIEVLKNDLQMIGERFTKINNDLNHPETLKSNLSTMCVQEIDEIDEIDQFESWNFGFTKGFRVTCKSGRRNRVTGSRTGQIKLRIFVTFKFKMWADGSWDTKVELSF